MSPLHTPAVLDRIRAEVAPADAPADASGRPAPRPDTRGVPAAFVSWAALLTEHRLTLLPRSHAGPLDAWLRTAGGLVLRVVARGTRVTLSVYEPSDLTAMVLRSECDCATHRQAGAARRDVLAPGSVPLASVVWDGVRERGWHGAAAGLARPSTLVPVVTGLLSEPPVRAMVSSAGATTVHSPTRLSESGRSCLSSPLRSDSPAAHGA